VGGNFGEFFDRPRGDNGGWRGPWALACRPQRRHCGSVFCSWTDRVTKPGTYGALILAPEVGISASHASQIPPGGARGETRFEDEALIDGVKTQNRVQVPGCSTNEGRHELETRDRAEPGPAQAQPQGSWGPARFVAPFSGPRQNPDSAGLHHHVGRNAAPQQRFANSAAPATECFPIPSFHQMVCRPDSLNRKPSFHWTICGGRDRQ